MGVSKAAEAQGYKNQFGPAVEQSGAFRVGNFIATGPTGRAMPFWRSLEDRLLALQNDRPRMARYMAVAWWVSNGFLLLGFLIILLLAIGWWEP